MINIGLRYSIEYTFLGCTFLYSPFLLSILLHEPHKKSYTSVGRIVSLAQNSFVLIKNRHKTNTLDSVNNNKKNTQRTNWHFIRKEIV